MTRMTRPDCAVMCVCVFSVFSSLSFWTSSSLDVPAGVTQEEGHTGFFSRLLSAVRALIFLARKIQPFLSLVDREVEFCVLTMKSFSTRWAFLFLFFNFLVRKIPFAGVELTSQRVRGLRDTSELPGRPACNLINIYIHTHTHTSTRSSGFIGKNRRESVSPLSRLIRGFRNNK